MSSLYWEALTTAFDAQSPACIQVRCPAARVWRPVATRPSSAGSPRTRRAPQTGAGHCRDRPCMCSSRHTAMRRAVDSEPPGDQHPDPGQGPPPVLPAMHGRTQRQLLLRIGELTIGRLWHLPHRPQEVAVAAARAAPGLLAGHRADFGIYRRPHGLAACRIAADAAIRSRKNSAATQRAIHADSTTTPLTSPSWWK